MTHELKNIVAAYLLAKQAKLKTALATVVDLDGSSYRKPGVRMLLREDGTMIGAVSGGCVEKEILRQTQSVFADGLPKLMTYDGRYRLGCEGILYILIEPFEPNKDFLNAFENILNARSNFEINSYFKKVEGQDKNMGSVFKFSENDFSVRESFEKVGGYSIFEETKVPCFQLLIVGAEHDAVQLGSYASLTGWEVTVVASAAEEKTKIDFPGVKELLSVEPEVLSADIVDEHTAVILMTHSYVRDLKYLLALKDTLPIYLGILGPSKRREKLLNELIERYPEVDEKLLDRIYGPAGLNIGAETAQEVALAVLSEILSIVRNQKPMMLKDKSGGIHS